MSPDVAIYETLGRVSEFEQVRPGSPTFDDRFADFALPMCVYSLTETDGVATLDRGVIPLTRTYSVIVLAGRHAELDGLERGLEAALAAAERSGAIRVSGWQCQGDDEDVESRFHARQFRLEVRA